MTRGSSVSPTAYATCGLAFSGKSSAARTVAAELGTDLISLDAINHERGLRGGEGIPVEEWEKTSLIAMERLRAALLAGRSVVVDDTFSHRFLRDRCKAVADACGSLFLILYMDTPIGVIEARRAENDRNPSRHHVRDDVFAAHRDGFQHPMHDEPVVRIGEGTWSGGLRA
jgi:predicted kinase